MPSSKSIKRFLIYRIVEDELLWKCPDAVIYPANQASETALSAERAPPPWRAARAPARPRSRNIATSPRARAPCVSTELSAECDARQPQREIRKIDEQRREHEHHQQEWQRSIDHIGHRAVAPDSLDDIKIHPDRGRNERYLAHQHKENAEPHRIDAESQDQRENHGDRPDHHGQGLEKT